MAWGFFHGRPDSTWARGSYAHGGPLAIGWGSMQMKIILI